MDKWITSAPHSLNGAVPCPPAGYTSLPLLLLYVLYVFNFVMMKGKSSGAFSLCRRLPSFSSDCFLVDNDRAESTGCHRLILPREEQEGKRKYKKQHD